MSRVLASLAVSTPRTLAAVFLLVALFVTAAVSLFALSVFGAAALYFVLWWTLLFAILPIRNQPETQAERLVPGQDVGAPAAPRLREKALWTTFIAGVAFLGALAVFPLAGL